MPASQFFALTARVANPLRDKRKRYGIEAVDFFEEGTGFLYSPAERDSPATVSVGSHLIAKRAIVDALMAHAVPSTPETWSEIKVAADQGSWARAADRTIEQLLAAGVVTPEQVADALRRAAGATELED